MAGLDPATKYKETRRDPYPAGFAYAQLAFAP